MECMRGNIRKVRCHRAWTMQTLLSVINIFSIPEDFPLSNLSTMELFAFVVPCISIIILMIMSAMHYIEYFKKIVSGTLFELGE